MKAIAVVGASLAGLNTARALRRLGYDGRLYLVGEEPVAPYDRTPLSKGFLEGRISVGALALGADSDAGLDIEWLLGRRATGMHPSRRTIQLADGARLSCDGVVVATGARARTLPRTVLDGAGRPAGVHTLRTVGDAQALRADLRPGSRLVIVGAGFIGAEVASTASALGVDVTVVERGPLPLAGVFGNELAAAFAARYDRHSVRVFTGTHVAGIEGAERVTGVRFADGRILRADAVLTAAGAIPAVDWLAGSGIKLENGVVCDASCATSMPNVVAVGDCANVYHPLIGAHHRTGHWTTALNQPAVAAARLLGGPNVRAWYEPLPYFWSVQFGATVQFAGVARPDDQLELAEGSYQSDSFLAVYRRDERPVAVCALNRPNSFAEWRRALVAPPDADVR